MLSQPFFPFFRSIKDRKSSPLVMGACGISRPDSKAPLQNPHIPPVSRRLNLMWRGYHLREFFLLALSTRVPWSSSGVKSGLQRVKLRVILSTFDRLFNPRLLATSRSPWVRGITIVSSSWLSEIYFCWFAILVFKFSPALPPRPLF